MSSITRHVGCCFFLTGKTTQDQVENAQINLFPSDEIRSATLVSIQNSSWGGIMLSLRVVVRQ